MEDPLDLDEQLEFWESELEEDGARLDVMPPPLPRSIQNTRTIKISRKVVLAQVAKDLPALEPRFCTWFRYSGFYSHVLVFVPDLIIPVKFHEVFCSSGKEFRTAEEAEEKAAEGMIRALEDRYSFGTEDLN